MDDDFGQLCRGRRIHMSGHSDLGIFNNFAASSILTWVLANIALTLYLKRVFSIILFSAEAILALNNSKSGPGVLLKERENLRSSIDSTISNSLIHSLASVEIVNTCIHQF